MNLPDLSKPSSPVASLALGFQSLPAMVGIIVCVIAGLLGGLIAAAFGASTTISVVVAAVIFALSNVLLAVAVQGAFFKFVRSVPARFPGGGESGAP
jgi:hypothetical protein